MVLDKDNYLSEGYRQLNMPYYEQIKNHNLENLQTELNKYINNMWSDGVLDKTTVKFIRDGLQKKTYVQDEHIFYLKFTNSTNLM